MRHLGTGLRFVVALLLAAIAGIAFAKTHQSYPSRAITLVIPFSPGTPDDVERELSSTIVRLARNLAFIDTLIAQGVEVRTLEREDFSREFGGEADRWAKVVTISGARVD